MFLQFVDPALARSQYRLTHAALHHQLVGFAWAAEWPRGDDEAFVERFEEMLGGRQVDLVMSDIAPNISGIPSSDQARSIYLAELALDFARKHLAVGGRFLVKVFQGEGFDAAAYDAELERLLLAIAEKTQAIKAAGGKP